MNYTLMLRLREPEDSVSGNSPIAMNKHSTVAAEEELRANSRPDRSLMALVLRRTGNWIRTTVYFWVKCSYARRNGLVRIPWNVSIWAPNRIIEFGHHVQFGPHCVIQCDIRFGNYVLVAGNVAFIGRNDHRVDVVGKTIWNSPRGDSRLTNVEDDVWIGYGAIILSGITIGRGAVIAAGAVVVSDVARYSIVAGVPAKAVATRFDCEDIQLHETILGIR